MEDIDVRIHRHEGDTPEMIDYLINKRIGDLTGFYPRDHYTASLDTAWGLHKYAPAGVTMFNMSWLALSPGEVAIELCKTWLDWTDRPNA